MTSAPDPADIQGPGLPRDPAEYGLRRRGFGSAWWAVMAVSFIFVLAAFAVGRFGARIFPVQTASPPANAQAPAQSGGAPSMAAPATSPPAVQSMAPNATPVAPAAEVAALGARVDRLQADQQRAARASGEALAAAALSEASQSSGRFDDQLAGLDQLLPDTTDLRALRALAGTGAPTRQVLAMEFAGVADRVAVAAHAPQAGASLVARLVHALTSVFTVRRVDRLTGDGPDAVLARAQRSVDSGDLETALKQLDRLPPTATNALAGWRGQADRRIEIDRRVADIRAAAVRDLAASGTTNGSAGAAARGATP